MKKILRLLNLGILSTLLGYWSIFIGYSVFELISGGPAFTLAWYEHIAYNVAGPLIQPFSPEAFALRQAAMLAGTLVLYFSARRSALIRLTNEPAN